MIRCDFGAAEIKPRHCLEQGDAMGFRNRGTKMVPNIYDTQYVYTTKYDTQYRQNHQEKALPLSRFFLVRGVLFERKMSLGMCSTLSTVRTSKIQRFNVKADKRF